MSDLFLRRASAGAFSGQKPDLLDPPEPPAAGPRVFVVAVRNGAGRITQLTDADTRTREDAERELAQWRRHSTDPGRYVLCRVTEAGQ